MIWFLVFGILGAIIGAAVGDEEGFVFGLAIGLLAAMVANLRERVTALERQLAHPSTLTRVEPKPEPAARAAAPVPELMKAPMKAPVTAPTLAPAEPDLQLPELELPPAQESEWKAAPPRIEQGPSALDEWGAKLRALLFGGNPVVRAGLVVLFFGVAFLFKFAAERELVPVELRYVGVVFGAMALLVVGWRQRLKRAGFAVLLQGGAVGMLYITVFAALRLHELIPAPFAFALLVALVILSGTLAVLQDARGLAVAGAVGGFLAPILVSTGSGDHVALFSYYALLNGGVLGVAWFRAWRVLNLVGFVFTFAIATVWGVLDYRVDLFWSTEPFLILFYFMYLALSVLYATRQPPVLRGYVDGTLVFGLPAIAFGLQAGLVRGTEFALAWSALGLAAIYLGLAAVLWRRAGEGMRLLTEAFLALGVVFGSIAIPLALEGSWTAAAWALEGAALVWVGVRQGRLAARLFGLLLQLGAGFFFFVGLDPYAVSDVAVFNGRFFGGLCVAAGGLVSAYQLRRHDALRAWEAPLEYALLAWGLLWWFGTSFSEAADQMMRMDWLHAYAAITAFTAVLMSEAARRFSWRTIALPLAGTGFLLLLFALGDLSNAHPFARFGFLGWGVAVAALYLVLRRQEGVLAPRVLGLQHQAGLWLVTLLLAAETAWAMDQMAEGGAVWSNAPWGIVLPAMALLSIRLSGRVTWPLAAYRRDYASEGPLPLLLLAAAGCIVSALTVEGDPYPLAYVPLFNPLELVQLFVVLALVRWRLLAVAPAALPVAVIDGAIGVTAFVVLNGALARAVHFYTGVPFVWSYLLHTTALQSAFAVAWTLLALVLTATAARIGRRQLWLIGAGLLGVVVVKLFLVDLASSNTIARIVSFLGVGVLMLAIGFLAPLPPAKRGEA